jgi:hypothetical protein
VLPLHDQPWQHYTTAMSDTMCYPMQLLKHTGNTQVTESRGRFAEMAFRVEVALSHILSKPF